MKNQEEKSNSEGSLSEEQEPARGEEAGRDEATPSPEDDVARLTRELDEKVREAADNYDLYLRERAELENFKKRMQREKLEGLRFANENLIRDLLPVLDNLERAIEHAESGGNGRLLVEGVALVLKSALDVLERHGVCRVEAVGEPFDPAQHEAVMQVRDATREPNQVVEQFLPGYCLHDRLLRAAQVSVSARIPVENEEDDD